MARSWRTKLAANAAGVPEGFESLVAPLFRGTTTIFTGARAAVEHWDQRRHAYSYGIHGTPTTLELAGRVSNLEGSFATFILPSGQAAIAAVCLSILSAGDHVLLPDSAYGPAKGFATEILERLGVAWSAYPPLCGEAIHEHLRPDTRLIWCESPGSITMEVQDVPAIVAAAHQRGVPVALDNTYSAGVLFDAFAAGVDISVQALTKYLSGHSDVFLASLSVGTEALYHQIGTTLARLGLAVSPADCSLALRGLQTLAVRLDAIGVSALSVAQWLAARPEITCVLHPALPSCPGHAVWQRDFTGSTGVFSILFRPEIDIENVLDWVDRLGVFKVGYSWGGVTSLAMPYPVVKRQFNVPEGHLVRLHVGLEPTADLIDDLQSAFQKMSASVGSPSP